ncbi:helix-turn-helix domain-containing protein [Zobellia uliginosa]|uniref:helix-turn-helix domain-containing protein n=1 Tax=Zobellia uliginosa TaxID=143224 RepID=UPI0026E1579D|nr:helix-turn-helix transcriptional regulator [Zobellia uliginosa]MDO6516876.1 helix-turn-helix transcriptional regulator [Zobellia uliginosa]
MVNTTDFIQRLEHLLSYYGLSASGFADKINVQRSSISHLLSGRNKPSLDFVLKVVKAFPEVNLYWLLNGKGSFPPEPKREEAPRPKPQTPSSSPQSIVQKVVAEAEKTIEKIVIFYSDGSFKAYDNK